MSEMFYVDKDGRKQDAELHEAILDNPEAAAICQQMALKRLKSSGMSEEEAKRWLGIVPNQDEKGES